MKSRIWFLVSIAAFIGAAFFWRLGDKIRLERSNKPESVAQQQAAHVKKPSAKATPAIATKKPSDNSSAAAFDATNSKALYPNRLSNTTKSIDQLTHDNKAILLRNALIDTGAGRVNIPDSLRAKGDPGSYIVQSRGPLTDVFRAELLAAKAQIISYVPNNAYLVRISGGGAEKLRANKGVQAVLPYEPYYKLDTDLLDLAVKNDTLDASKFVRVTWFPGEQDAGETALKGKGTIVSDDPKSSPFGPESIVSTTDLIALANLKEVQGIETVYQRTVLNDLTRVRLGVATNTLIGTPNLQNLTGANVLVNVNDTTIDSGHPDLAGRVFSPLSPLDTTDEIGHGTHVAGIIAGSGASSSSVPGVPPGSVAGADYRGKAPAANIFSLDIISGGLSDAYVQETAALTNILGFNRNSPLISNNSWSEGNGYNSAAASYDKAVRDAVPDMQGSQPIIYVFAAGNSGSANDNGQGGFAGTITSPGAAKNVITVGALESPRNITNDIIRPNSSCVVETNKEFLGFTDSSNEVASFSSRGNVGVSQEGTYGRFKPDVVAPGTFIISTRSRQLDEGAYYSTTNYIRQDFPKLVIDPGDTNRFSIFVPEDPCDQGDAIELDIETARNGGSPNPFPGLQIFVDTSPQPANTPANFVNTNIVTLLPGDPKFAKGTTVYYDIVNTNDIAVNYDLHAQVVVTNDYGNYFTELKSLNDSLGTNYFYESGTSMAAPAVSGMLALMQEFFEQKLPTPRTNSPAMMKALLINCARSPNDLLYKFETKRNLNSSGWGLPNLARVLPDILASETDTNKWPIQMFDQSTNNALATGQTDTRTITVTDTNSPLRMTLVWTDPPGNPQVGVKLVNDLDLVVKTVVTNDDSTVSTNVYFGNHFSGGSQFTDPIDISTNALSDFDSERDVVNNVENVYINGPLNGSYEVSVVARRVNVNAVTAHTNGIVQDYALVISSGDLTTNAPFTISAVAPVVPETNALVTVITNGMPLFNQRVGANSPYAPTNGAGLSDGTLNQWNFYVLNNTNHFQNVAFLTFLTPNLSGTTNISPNSRRNKEADIDMYVSTNPALTNLDATAVATADKSLHRGGQESIIYTNATADVFYVGIKSEDQQAAEFGFFGMASATPFSQEDENGNLHLFSLVTEQNGIITDGSPEKPGGSVVFAIATKPITLSRVIATNTLTHERIGDLLGTLTHNDDFAVLNNHSFPVSDAFPDGQESGTFTGIYDDSELAGTDGIADSRHTDGPGSLNDFVGKEGVGIWMLTMEDNALNATGRVDNLSLFLERALDTNQLAGGASGFTISGNIPAHSSRGLTFVVPDDATNMIISIAPKDGALDTVLRRGIKAPTRSAPGGPYVDIGKLINPPGDKFNLSVTNTPPLQPGRYTLRLYNDGGSPVSMTGSILFELDLTARSFQTYVSGSPKEILDDAVTNSTINVNRDGRIVNVEVGVRIDHPRIADLVLHLVSPEGTRILLAENRGGATTNGYGFANLTTNVVDVPHNGDGTASTNIIAATQNTGILNVDYNFYDAPDQMQIYYDGSLIYDTGFISDSGSISIPFGPGLDTNVVVVMNGNGNPDPSNTAWDYTATIVSGQLVYATFSEDTNMALVPIKFAIPPFATNFPGSNIVSFLAPTGDFETEAAGVFGTGANVDGWDVLTNSVMVENMAGIAYSGTNYLNLHDGSISRTLPTVAGKLYNLKFAYRRAPLTTTGGATIGIEGVYTNDFIGTAGWIPYSQSFSGKDGGTKLQLDGIMPDMLFDGFQLVEGGDPNYFLPEESLATLIGEQARGQWKLEVWDNRAGQPVPGGAITSWKLNLTFTSSNATASVVQNAVETTNTVSGADITYFIIDVPINATHATNTLTSLGGPLNLLFNQNELPVGSPSSGDYTLLLATAAGTYDINTLTGPPYLQPGRRYYLGVQNANRSQTNQFTLRVDFDNTNNLVEVTPLANATPISTNLPLNRAIHYYQYDLSNSVSSLTFTLTGLSDDADLVVRLNSLATQAQYDFISANGGTADETIIVPNPVPGRYYVGVYGYFPTNGIDYTVTATEGGAPTPGPKMSPTPSITPSGIEITANTIVGRDYQLEVSKNLTDWFPVTTITATSTVTTFSDPTPPASDTARFYRLRLLP